MTPITSVESQNMRALGNAHKVRAARAGLRREVRSLPRPAGLAVIAGVLLDPPDQLGSLPVGDLLRFVNGVGAACARGILVTADPVGPISENKPVRDLTARQRRVLADYLRAAYERATRNGTVLADA